MAAACGDDEGGVGADASVSLDAAPQLLWGDGVAIGSGERPAIGMDADGNAIAVWSRRGESGAEIWANRYEVGAGWGTATIINIATEPRDGMPLPVDVAVEPDGDAVAVWHEPDDQQDNVWANRFEVEGGWGTAELLGSGDGNGRNPQVAVDAEGNAAAVWHHQTVDTTDVWASRFTAGVGWGTPEPLETHDAAAYGAQVSAQPDGGALAVWIQAAPEAVEDSRHVWARRYIDGAGWSPAEQVDAGREGSARPDIALATDSAGNAVALWWQSDFLEESIIVNRYTVAAGWEASERLDVFVGASPRPLVAMDAAGGAIVMWYRDSASPDFRGSAASHYVVGDGWTKPEVIEIDGSVVGQASDLAGNASGQALAAITEEREIRPIHYTRDTGWVAGQPVQSAGGFSEPPRLAMDGTGRALLVWSARESADDQTIRASRHE